MGWLGGYTIASWLGATIIVRIYDLIVGGLVGGGVHTARTGLFVGAWTAITTWMGMRDFNGGVRKLRQRNREVSERIKGLPQKKKGGKMGGGLPGQGRRDGR